MFIGNFSSYMYKMNKFPASRGNQMSIYIFKTFFFQGAYPQHTASVPAFFRYVPLQFFQTILGLPIVSSVPVSQLHICWYIDYSSSNKRKVHGQSNLSLISLAAAVKTGSYRLPHTFFTFMLHLPSSFHMLTFVLFSKNFP